MHRRGFTLVELLVVLAIMGLVGIITFVNVKSSREEENLKTAVSDLQSYLRLAQSNATTGVKCGSEGGVSWSIVITDRTSIKLKCQTQEIPVREWTIKTPAQIDSIEGIGTLSCSFAITTDPVAITFSYLNGQAAFSDPKNSCLSESTGMRIKLIKQAGSTDLKIVTIGKGGAIDVQ